jgi:hypothetical protein
LSGADDQVPVFNFAKNQFQLSLAIVAKPIVCFQDEWYVEKDEAGEERGGGAIRGPCPGVARMIKFESFRALLETYPGTLM